MSKDFNISMICLILNWFVYDPSWMLHLSEFVRTLRSSALVVFNNFLLIDATARRKISSDQKRFFIALSLYPLSFFANTPFKCKHLFKIIHFDKKNPNFDLQGRHMEVAEAVEVWSEYQNSLLQPQPSPGTLGASQSFGSPRNQLINKKK